MDEQILKQNTPRIILINGFNSSVKKNELFDSKIFVSDKQYLKLLFISRLVKDKVVKFYAIL